MIGAIIGGALKVGGALAGGIMAARKAKKADERINNLQKQNQNWYDYESSADYTQRADSQAVLNRIRDMYNERNKNAAAAQAVTGASDEATALAKEASNSAIAETASNIAAQASAHKDSVGAEFRQRQNDLTQQQAINDQQKAQNIQNAVSGISEVAGGIAGADFSKSKAGFTPEKINPNLNINSKITGEVLDNYRKQQYGK